MKNKKIMPFKEKIWLSSPTMHDGEELKYKKPMILIG